MPIRPIDVRRKEFKNSLRGYDANQVDDFLDAVADEFERTYTDNSRMREEISSLRERLQQFEELEGSIRAALVHAEQAAEDLRRSSTREAEDLRQSAAREADFTIREAKARAHQLLAESSARVERIQESYEALQEAKRGFANDFRHLLKTYTDMMENMEIVSAREVEASLRERLDTESIAIAHEAATHEAAVETEEHGRDEGDSTPAPTAEPPPETEQHDEEPESSTTGYEAHPLAEEPTEEPASAESAEREEASLAEEKNSQSFFDRKEEPATPPSEQGQTESRIARASRFLRRRE